MDSTIYLDADLFMALGLSAEAHGGIGRAAMEKRGEPHCVFGHICHLATERSVKSFVHQAEEAGLGVLRNDDTLMDAGLGYDDKVPFADWLRIIGVDVRDAAVAEPAGHPTHD